MKASLPRLLTGLVVLPAVLVLLAARLSGASASTLAAPLPNPEFDAGLATAAGEEIAYFAGGCFWGVEGVFEHVKGVKSAVSGYSGGDPAAANYDAVSGGNSGHAEAVKVVFDPKQISYGQLLKIFFTVAHDPTQLNRQGPDRGTQYRSAIFYDNAAQQQIAKKYIDQLTAAKSFPKPIVTQLVKLDVFHEAEKYHQDYMVHHPNQPYIMIHDAPKVAALKKQFAAVYRER